MRFVVIQILLFFASGEIVKRSPLQIGFVTFTEKPHLLQNLTHRTNVIMGAHTHKWIPGHVRQHAYIPAHLDHLYIPTHALVLTRTLQTVFVQPTVYNPYRQHLGGFGIGVDVGGHGAGHGFHVVFNF